MEFSKFGRDFFTRHSIKPKGEDKESVEFKGISEKGVEKAEERAKEILEDVKKAEKGTVMFLGGSSDMVRTKSTALVYGKKIKELILQEKIADVLVFLPEDLEKIDGFNNKVNFLSEQIENNPDKKIIVDIPLFLKEFSLQKGWVEKDGSLTPYTKELLKRNNNNEEEAMKDWFQNKGKIGELNGPDPKETAKEHLIGLERLRNFAKKYIKNRLFDIGVVGHSWTLDAVAMYLIDNGEISKEKFESLKAKMIGETKRVRITQDEEGKELLEYGDLKIPLE